MRGLSPWLLLCAFCLTTLAFAQENGGQTNMVSLVTLDGYAPLCFPREGQENQGREVIAPGADSNYLQGYAWDVVREAFQSQGYMIVLNTLPWSQAESAARLGSATEQLASVPTGRKSDYKVEFSASGVTLLSNQPKIKRRREPVAADLLFPAVRSSAREAVFTFSSSPVDEMRATLYMLHNSTMKVSGPTSLRGHRIGVMDGWSYGNTFDALSGVERITLESPEAGFRLLRQGRLDAVAGYQLIFDRELKRIHWQGRFQKLPADFTLKEYLCGITESPRTNVLLQSFERGLKKLAENGYLKEISRKWGVVPEPAKGL